MVNQSSNAGGESVDEQYGPTKRPHGRLDRRTEEADERDGTPQGTGHAKDARCSKGDLSGQPLHLSRCELSGIPCRLDAPPQVLDILQGVRLGHVVPGLPGLFQLGNVGFKLGL